MVGLSVHPWLYETIVGLHKTESTYALVEVDRVFAGDDISDGAAAGLAGGLLACLCAGGHFLEATLLADVLRRYRHRGDCCTALDGGVR